MYLNVALWDFFIKTYQLDFRSYKNLLDDITLSSR